MRTVLLLIGAGGLGTGLRYACSVYLNRPGFPWGTLTVNIAGALLIGLVGTFALEARAISREAALIITTGFLGGLTTFSSFAFEGDQMLQRREFLLSGLYTLGSLALGLLAVWCGHRLGSWMISGD